MKIGAGVVIPVYGQFAVARACLESVLEHTRAEILVLDDASPEGPFEETLPAEWLTDGRLRIVRNPRNRGFAASCNQGLARFAGRDVVLLNSDTLVTPGWLEKLSRAAHACPRTGTATPLSNAGSLCSFPHCWQEGELAFGFGLAELAELVESHSQRCYPEIPVCVGFCVYLRRDMLDRVGDFDCARFAAGYGEEVELALRARRAGFVHRMDDATFIYHRGGSSFGARGAELKRRAEASILELYPGYHREIGAWVRSDFWAQAFRPLLEELIRRWRRGRRGAVLHVLHAHPDRQAAGGVELHVAQLLEIPEWAGWSLVPEGDGGLLTAHFPGGEFRFRIGWEQLERVLAGFDLVHVHHLHNYPQARLVELLRSRGSYLFSLHDLASVCPRLFCCTPAGRVCAGSECAGACAYAAAEVEERRAISRRLLDGARLRVAFSRAGPERLARLLGGGWEWSQQGQAVPARAALPAPEWPPGQPVRVLVLGYCSVHKGAEWLAELATLAGVEWHVLGDVLPRPGGSVVIHGGYRPAELAKRVAQVQPHLAAHLSVTPESYGRTLDECWSLGLPVLVTAGGGPEERVRATGAGWVVEAFATGAVRSLLKRLPEELEEARARVRAIRLLELEDERRHYAGLYAELAAEPIACAGLVGACVGAPAAPSRGLRARVQNRLRRWGWTLRLQRTLRRILPASWVRWGRSGLEWLEGLRA